MGAWVRMGTAQKKIGMREECSFVSWGKRGPLMSDIARWMESVVVCAAFALLIGCRQERSATVPVPQPIDRKVPQRVGDSIDLYQGAVLTEVYGVEEAMLRGAGGKLLAVIAPLQSQLPVEFVFGADSSARFRLLEVLDSLLDSLSRGRKALVLRDSLGMCGVSLNESESSKVWDSAGFFKVSTPSPDDFGAKPIRWKLPRVERDLGDPGGELRYWCRGVLRISGRLMYSYQLRKLCREAQDIETNPFCIDDEFLVDAGDGSTWGWGSEGRREFVIRRGGDGVRILKVQPADSSKPGSVVESGCHDQSFLWRYGKDGKWLEGISLATGKCVRRISLAPTSPGGKIVRMGGDLEVDSTGVVYALEVTDSTANVYRAGSGNRFTEVSRGWNISRGDLDWVRFVGFKFDPCLRTEEQDYRMDEIVDWEELAPPEKP
jgi:hypothetical protein